MLPKLMRNASTLHIFRCKKEHFHYHYAKSISMCYRSAMAKEKKAPGASKLIRLDPAILEKLQQINEKLPMSENACIQLAILRLWEAEFAPRR